MGNPFKGFAPLGPSYLGELCSHPCWKCPSYLTSLHVPCVLGAVPAGMSHQGGGCARRRGDSPIKPYKF
eukprot:6091241-Pyramimonas_sp.AAC.5